MEDRSGSIWLELAEYTGVSHLKVVNEGAVQFYPEPVEYDTETHVNNIRMLATATDGDIYLGTRDGKVYVYDAALSRPKERRYSKNIYALCEDAAGTLLVGESATACMWTVKGTPTGQMMRTRFAANEIFLCCMTVKDGCGSALLVVVWNLPNPTDRRL